ncbi:hypothetical protein SS37A_06440 [Methylocystis iwaonis]|uniref:Uncharacterized protein n=2 Tax=Methylocystis iwaonis TaxID=2885079 RepID=A0ABM8E5L8_9HYPH|nr:hypothetical protein SS37A_06440 [Methylocystis iwaonis]
MTAIFEIDDATGRVVDLYVSSSILAEPKDSQAPKSKKRGATEKVSESENDAPNIRFANDASFGSDFKEFIKHNSLRVDEFQIEPYEMNFSGQKNSLSGTEIYMTSKGINSDEISNTLWKAFDIQLDNAQPPKAEDNLEEFLREGKTFKHGTLRLANGFHNHPNLNVYFAAYAQSHVVQDQFLAIPFLRIAEQSIRGLMIRFSPTEMDIPYKKAKEFIFLCDSKLIFEDSIPNVSECTTYALAYIGPALRHIYYWSRISNPPVGPIMVSVFASTGLFLAMLFYASLALYVLSAVTLRTTWILGVGRGWFDLEKNPFAVSAGIIIVTVLPMGLILGQVVSMILEPH